MPSVDYFTLGVQLSALAAAAVVRPPRACACGQPREPLLEYEMHPGERADSDMCRACFEA